MRERAKKYRKNDKVMKPLQQTSFSRYDIKVSSYAYIVVSIIIGGIHSTNPLGFWHIDEHIFN